MSTQITKDSFESFYNDTYKNVLKYTICHCNNLDDVNDIVQEIYTELYQKIVENIKQQEKRKIQIKTFQYALVPFGAIFIICAALIFNNKNNNKSDLLLAKENYNTIMNNDNIINIENKIIDAEKIYTQPVLVGKKEIYKIINNGSESCWVYDPTIPENIIKDNKIPKYVVKVKIVSVDEGEMLPKQENFYNPYTCFTPIKMQVIDNLSDNKISGTIKAYINGGTIKISNLLKSIDNEEARNIGILNLSKEEQEKYIQYIWSEPYYEPTIGDEYIMIISKINENLYQISFGGYGIFKVNNQEKYINVITNKEWKI